MKDWRGVYRLAILSGLGDGFSGGALMHLNTGEKIVVYDSRKIELGEGTFLRCEKILSLGITVYECREHAILAKGVHYVRKDDQLYKIDDSTLFC